MAKIEKKILLIAEDDEIMLRALYLAFQEEGYTISSANDGEAALKMIQRLKPDMVVLDLLMPKMTGLDVIKNVKADPAIKDTRIIILSNLGDVNNVESAKKLGVDDYFLKAEVSLDDLVKKVRKILKNK